MDAIFLTSGDVIIDRRFEWARDLEAKGDLAGAADLLAQTVELSPGYAAAWFALGHLRELQGETAGAIVAFEQARAIDPEDRHGASLRLTRLGAAQVAMSDGYVRTLFDGYALTFDSALRMGLGYRAPELMRDAVRAARPEMTFGAALDLGCGTGLGGAAFRPFCKTLVGVDLSPAMVAQARTKTIYDRLVEGEVVEFLNAEAVAHTAYDIVIAADLFGYLDDLTAVLGAAARVLAPGGLIVFSAETHQGDGVILRDTLRYAHAESHVRGALAAAGLHDVSLDFAAARSEKGVPVPGLVVVARRRCNGIAA
ncbi:MAG: methyltransferase domain-containing protein [Hyphomicrobiales bacterium]|nr:methyltransferase domain-containing protein [Hyphomicrobiales bacterium]